MGNDRNSLAHTSWNCQYHIVIVPKYRRQIIYGKYRSEIGKILRTICERYEVEIVEANACADHIHMLVKIPPKLSVSRYMGILKGKSTLMIFDRFANLKYKYTPSHKTALKQKEQASNQKYNLYSNNCVINSMKMMEATITGFVAKLNTYMLSRKGQSTGLTSLIGSIIPNYVHSMMEGFFRK